MKRHLVYGLLLLGGCASHSVTAPTPLTAPPTTVAVLSQKTGQTTLVTISADAPQPPSCAWRDTVIELHISLGGSTNDIVTLANLHKVFLQGTGDGYDIWDNPVNWCLGGSGGNGNVTHVSTLLVPRVANLVSCNGEPITPDTFATAPHPDPGSSCWSLDGVSKRRF